MTEGRPSVLGAVGRIREAAISEVMRGHSHAAGALLSNVAQTILLVGVFYLISVLSGFGTALIRGDLLIYLISGVFLYNLHVKSVQAVFASDRADAAAAKRPRAARMLATLGAAAGCLYTQIVSVMIVLVLYRGLVGPFEIDDIYGAVSMLALSWLSGASVGLMLLALKTRLPGFAGFASQAYSRINMVASGQMFVANSLPVHVIGYLSWNPLFHMIDQARGFAFLNYTPWFSNLGMPTLATAGILVVGLVLDRSARRPARGAQPD